MKEFKALVVAEYNFTDKKGKEVHTTKLLVCLGDYGTIELCTPLANGCELLTEIKVRLGYKRNNFVIDSIVK